MVVAGPGTGKTQLLATRVANILRKNDTILPTNILCLTFTEAGQAAMQQRLAQIMGDAGAHVAVHTFHSFGAEIINRYPQYFYGGLQFQPADPLTTHEIMLEILDGLGHDNPLAIKNKGEYIYAGSIKKLLSQVKKAALSPDEVKAYARHGLEFINYIEPTLIDVFGVDRFTTTADIDRSDMILDALQLFTQEEISVPGATSLAEIFRNSFEAANQAAHEIGKAKPLNDWKKDWYKKDKTGKPVCKQRDIHEKLLAFADIFSQYRQTLEDRRLFDFDDMINRVVHAVESSQELAYDIQEQYHYFLVDEFQDTNAGQLRLLTALANHPVHEGRPNVMVVGDDDQAIFAFQGAELSNILNFEDSYNDVARIVLEDNYRSQASILEASRAVITQGVDRLETRRNITKKLVAKTVQSLPYRLDRHHFTTQSEELFWIAKEIHGLVQQGHAPQDIAVIGREHKQLEALLPFLARENLPVWYERQQNALDDPIVKQLIVLVRAVHALASDEYSVAETYLPELLAAPFWGLSAEQLWRIGLASARSKRQGSEPQGWLEVIQSYPAGTIEKSIATLLLETAKLARTETLETVLDVLMGNSEYAMHQDPDTSDDQDEESMPAVSILSPFKQFYFSEQRLKDNPRAYSDVLTALVALRNRVRQFTNTNVATLQEFVRFVDLTESAGMGVTSRPVLGSQANSVQLLTAHGSKGLEYETVFLLSAVGDVWDKTPRGDKLSLPPNMLHIAHPAQLDDNLRILFVTMTRAKRQLIISGYQHIEPGSKAAKSLAALEHPDLQSLVASQAETTPVISGISDEISIAEANWHDSYTTISQTSLKSLLADRLADYKLSVTHLHSFLDVAKGGPMYFLLNNLLRFPSSMSPSGAFGDAVHKTLQDIHTAVLRGHDVPDVQQATSQFERLLAQKHLTKNDFKNYLVRGERLFKAFYEVYAADLRKTQKPEQDFFAQGVQVGSARISGKLDLLEVDGSAVYVRDYKTGKPLTDWDAGRKTGYEKIKQHHYRQQLQFYKILIDGARDYGAKNQTAVRGELVFVEPTTDGIVTLGLDFDDAHEIERMKLLIEKVWRHIQAVDFPDVSGYAEGLEGIKQFEQDLLDDKI